MAKRRILKRDISYVAGDLFSEALFCKLYLPGVNSEKPTWLWREYLICKMNLFAVPTVRTEKKTRNG